MSELETISPPPRVVSVGGHSLEIFPLKVRQFPVVLRAVRPILGALSDRLDAEALVGAYVDNADSINHALAAISGLTVDQIADLSLEEAVELLAATIEINRDFFTRTLPRLVGSVTGGNGATQ